MAVKILIKRKVPEGKTEALSDLLRQLRVLTMSQKGYISGETLKRIDSPKENLVISTWESADAWRKWVRDEKRLAVQRKIDALLGEETSYEIYEHL